MENNGGRSICTYLGVRDMKCEKACNGTRCHIHRKSKTVPRCACGRGTNSKTGVCVDCGQPTAIMSHWRGRCAMDAYIDEILATV